MLTLRLCVAPYRKSIQNEVAINIVTCCNQVVLNHNWMCTEQKTVNLIFTVEVS